jgi:hypothetical protein
MLLALLLWEQAIKQVDKDPSRVKTRVEDPGYCSPDPSLVISGGSPEQRQIFMANWLGVRKFWIKQLEEDTTSQHSSTQQWRDFLIQSRLDSLDEDEAGPSNGKGKTKAKLCQSRLSQVFAEGVYMTQGSCLGPKESVEWCDQTVSIASLTNLPVHLVRAILWELFELGFHHKLRAIDRAMVPDLWVKVLQA